MRTAQEIFNIVVAHLRQQNSKSMTSYDETLCAFRGTDGRKCAIGALIPDECYDPYMEGIHFTEFDAINEKMTNLRDEFIAHESLLQDLLIIHDRYDLDKWEDSLANIAKKFYLQFPV